MQTQIPLSSEKSNSGARRVRHADVIYISYLDKGCSRAPGGIAVKVKQTEAIDSAIAHRLGRHAPRIA